MSFRVRPEDWDCAWATPPATIRTVDQAVKWYVDRQIWNDPGVTEELNGSIIHVMDGDKLHALSVEIRAVPEIIVRRANP